MAPTPASPSPAQPRAPRVLYAGAFILAIVVLYLGREILIPLALAAFFAFLLNGMVRRVERGWIGRLPAVLIALAAATLLFLAIGGVVAYQSALLVDQFPQYRTNVREKFGNAKATFKSWFSEAAQAVNDLQEDFKTETQPAAGAAATEPKPVSVKLVDEDDALEFGRSALDIVVHPLITLGIALVFTFFFLMYREDLRDRLLRVLGQAQLHVSTTALTDAGLRVSRYLVAFALANGIAGAAIAIGLLLLGVPNWFLWGFLTALLRFIPFLGPLIAAAFPVALSIAVSDTWTEPVLVVAWFLLVDIASANLVEPFLYGTRTGASPTAIVFAFIFWTWLWGPFGLLLAMPMTVCLVALGRHIPHLEILSVVFGDQPVFRPEVRLYQRLLSNDTAEARRVVENAAEELDRITVFDRVIGPALGRVAADWASGLLTPDRREAVLRAVQTVLKVDDDSPSDAAAAEAEPSSIENRVILWSAGHALEDVALPHLAEILEAHGVTVVQVSSRTMISELAATIAKSEPRAVLLLANTHARARRLTLLRRQLAATGAATRLVALVLDESERLAAPALYWRTPRNDDVVGSLAGFLRSLPGVIDAPPAPSQEPPAPTARLGESGAAVPAT